jgi:NAD+ kinase
VYGVTDGIEDLPPSAKLVLKVLEVEGAHDKDEIVECTGLPPSTARYATEVLVEEEHVERRIDDGTVVYEVA